ncbi:MAG: CaiB/BaiF CoA-transferase family protein [Chloroflexi bacterium OHK40]
MGPLSGLRVIELASLGPAPFCAMLLADMGADVLRIERPSPPGVPPPPALLGSGLLSRGRPTLTVDLKAPGGRALALRLIGRCDALIEGYRPGVMERLGLGPTICLAHNPRLVYGRMTGWGQHGSLAHAPGHDINYIALSGALHAIGSPDAPAVPLNLLGDFGGGGLLLAFGLVCALLEARNSGRGQVVDAAMVDGAALLMTMIYQLRAAGAWENQRGANPLDGGAPFYGTYACADGKWLAVGALEPRFYAALLAGCGLHDVDPAAQWDRTQWPALRVRLARIFASRPRDEWCVLLEGSDACVAPVLDLDEAPTHPHNQARRTFVNRGTGPEPAPAPRFSRSGPPLAETPEGTPTPEQILAAWGLDPGDALPPPAP